MFCLSGIHIIRQTNPTTGQRTWRAGKDCKASEAYPKGFGEAVAKVLANHREELQQHSRDLENLSEDIPIRNVLFQQMEDEWTDAELGRVWQLLT